MARYRFPAEVIQSLQRVCELPDDQFVELLSALGKAMPATSSRRLKDQVIAHLAGATSEIAAEFIENIYGLSCSRVAAEVSTADFIRDCLEGMADVEPPVKPERLTAVLAQSVFSDSAKAYVLQREHQRFLLKSKIITDCRPVFGNDSDKIIGHVVSHMLKISYFENMERHEFFVALDDQDLSDLHAALTRAQNKNKELTLVLDKSGIPNI